MSPLTLLYYLCSYLLLVSGVPNPDSLANFNAANVAANSNTLPTSSPANNGPAMTTVSTRSITVNTTSLADPDFITVAARRVEFAVGQQTGRDNVPAWSSTLGADGKWPDSEVDYTTGCDAQRANWPAQEHWQRIATMAASWHGGRAGGPPGFVNNATLLAQISSAMDWWFARDFTVPDCLDNGGAGACPCGTQGLWNTNWFSNVILIPKLVGQACIMLNSSLTPTQLSSCSQMTRLSYGIFKRSVLPGFVSGANILDMASIGIADAVLVGDTAMLEDAYAIVHKEVDIKTGIMIDGISSDGGFQQHSGLLYNGNYGKDYTNDVLEIEIEAGGTRFAAQGASRSAFETLMGAAQWMIFQNTHTGVLHWDFSVLGRFISFPVIDAQATGSININLTEIQVLAGLWGSDALQSVYTHLTTNTSSANVGQLEGNRVFYANDYMVTRGSNYVSTVKMYSTRTRNSENTNSQNPFGFHLADGAMYTYIDGDEYEDISVAWDWNLIPGTTVDYGATPLVGSTENHVGAEDFVGGVSTGTTGLAVMRYTNPQTHNFRFQKAFFYFENMHHVTVSVLASNTSAPVFSVLDQSKHSGDIYVNGATVAPKGGNFSNTRTIYHAKTGYIFDDAPSVSISAGPSTGSWSAIGTSTQGASTVDLFAAWIPHDAAHLTSPVSYTVFPGREQAAFQAEASGDCPVITRNAGTDVSAVEDRESGTVMMVFWQPTGGTVTADEVIITSDSALVAIFDRTKWVMTVADPSQTLKTANLTFEVRWKKPTGWGVMSRKTIPVTFPTSPNAGSSITVSLSN